MLLTKVDATNSNVVTIWTPIVVWLLEWTPKGHLFQTNWITCSNISTILGPVVKEGGGEYMIIFCVQEFSL